MVGIISSCDFGRRLYFVTVSSVTFKTVLRSVLAEDRRFVISTTELLEVDRYVRLIKYLYSARDIALYISSC